MDATRLIFGVGIGIISLFLRWRWPSVPKALASFGIIVGVGVTVWALSGISATTLVPWVLCLALFAALAEVLLNRRSMPSKNGQNERAGEAQADDAAQKRAAKRREQQIFGELIATTRTVGSALAGSNEGNMRNAIPDLRSTLLTLHKEYGLRIPTLPEGARPRRCLQVGVSYFREMGPLLRQGHIDESRERAEALVPMLDAFVAERTNSLPGGQG